MSVSCHCVVGRRALSEGGPGNAPRFPHSSHTIVTRDTGILAALRYSLRWNWSARCRCFDLPLLPQCVAACHTVWADPPLTSTVHAAGTLGNLEANKHALCLSSQMHHRLVGLVVKASASRAEGPGFESRWRRDFFGVESYQ